MAQSLRMPVFLLILGSLFLLDLAWWRLSDRWLHPQKAWRNFNILFLLTQLLAFGYLLVGRLLGIRWNLPAPLMSAVYLWHLFVLPLLLVIGLGALPFLLVRLLVPKNKPAPAPCDDSTTQTRRQFLITAATVTPPLVNLALTGFSQSQLEQFRLREMTLAIPNLPPALSGMTICHVTDLHVGPFTSERVIRRVAEKVNSLRADLVLFTGDLINSRLDELPLGIDFLRSLDSRQGRQGIAIIEGNHDLFEGRAAFEQAIRAADLRLLVNEIGILRVRDYPVELLGLRWGGPGENAHVSGDDLIRSSMRALLAQHETDGAFPILLAHHPHAFDPAAEAGLPLTLSGHTHGGQLMLNPQVGAGPLMFRYWSGLYTRARSQMIVSNGVGNWFPLRTASPAEIIHLTLRRAV